MLHLPLPPCLTPSPLLFSVIAPQTMLARIQGIVGPFPGWMLEGEEAPKYFTAEGCVYQRMDDGSCEEREKGVLLRAWGRTGGGKVAHFIACGGRGGVPLLACLFACLLACLLVCLLALLLLLPFVAMTRMLPTILAKGGNRGLLFHAWP